MAFTDSQIQRYSRHVLLPDFGGLGQRRLLAATVRVHLHPGEVASHFALAYLASCGVGRVVVSGGAGLRASAADTAASPLLTSDMLDAPLAEALCRAVADRNPDVQFVIEPDSAVQPCLDFAPADGAPEGAGSVDALLRAGQAITRLLVQLAEIQ